MVSHRLVLLPQIGVRLLRDYCLRKAPNGAAKILINGNYMEVYNPQGEEDELLKRDQKEAYIWPANGQTSHGQQNNNSDDAPLHAAVRNRKPDVVGFRLDNGGDVKSKDKLSNTPLHLAIVTGQANIVKVLLDRRAKTSERNSNYNTPLHLVVQNGQMETAKLLLNRQADLAALNGKVDVVKLLRKGGADVEAKDTDGNKSLHLASLAGKGDMTKLLSGPKIRWWSSW